MNVILGHTHKGETFAIACTPSFKKAEKLVTAFTTSHDLANVLGHNLESYAWLEIQTVAKLV